VESTLKFALVVWLIAALPLILTNAAFIKLHRIFVVFYALSWLIKLAIIAFFAGSFLH
jgi:hypothetical protein